MLLIVVCNLSVLDRQPWALRPVMPQPEMVPLLLRLNLPGLAVASKVAPVPRLVAPWQEVWQLAAPSSEELAPASILEAVLQSRWMAELQQSLLGAPFQAEEAELGSAAAPNLFAHPWKPLTAHSPHRMISRRAKTSQTGQRHRCRPSVCASVETEV